MRDVGDRGSFPPPARQNRLLPGAQMTGSIPERIGPRGWWSALGGHGEERASKASDFGKRLTISNFRGGATLSHARCIHVTAGQCRPNRLRKLLRLTTFVLFIATIATQGLAAQINLVTGSGPVASVIKWAGKSAISVIPGAALFPTTSKTTALYLGFTAGTRADINNMVLYQTDTRSPAITSVTKITLNGVSNPSVDLTDPKVCPDQPVSATAPCLIRLDLLALQLTTSSDSYLVIYFTAPDSNNDALGLAKPAFGISSLTGWLEFTDQTRHVVGESLNTLINSGRALGLTAVMNQ